MSLMRKGGAGDQGILFSIKPIGSQRLGRLVSRLSMLHLGVSELWLENRINP